MERVKGIEPSYEAWEAAVLPLNYTRLSESDDNALAWVASRANACSREKRCMASHEVEQVVDNQTFKELR